MGRLPVQHELEEVIGDGREAPSSRRTAAAGLVPRMGGRMEGTRVYWGDGMGCQVDQVHGHSYQV